MKLIFDPGAENDLAEIRFPHGNVMLTLKRGVAREVADGVAAGLLRAQPDWFKKAAADIQAEAAPAPAPKK